MTCPIHRVKAFVGWTPEGGIHAVMVPWDVHPCECASSVASSLCVRALVGRRGWVEAWRQCERDLLGPGHAARWEKDPSDIYDTVIRRKSSMVVRGVVVANQTTF